MQCTLRLIIVKAGGVTFLFKPTFEHKIHNIVADPGGNFLLIDLEIQSNRLTLGGIYGPNTDEPSFFPGS